MAVRAALSALLPEQENFWSCPFKLSPLLISCTSNQGPISVRSKLCLALPIETVGKRRRLGLLWAGGAGWERLGCRLRNFIPAPRPISKPQPPIIKTPDIGRTREKKSQREIALGPGSRTLDGIDSLELSSFAKYGNNERRWPHLLPAVREDSPDESCSLFMSAFKAVA